MKKLLILMLAASLTHAAQQLEKPKLSCMAKMGLPTLHDRFEIMQTEHKNYLKNRNLIHKQNIRTQIMAIQQLQGVEKVALLNTEPHQFEECLELISHDIHNRKQRNESCALIVSLITVGSFLWLTLPPSPCNLSYRCQ